MTDDDQRTADLHALAAVSTNSEFDRLVAHDPLGVVDAARWARREIDRLRAELAETRATGDALAVATYAMTMQLRRHLSGEAGYLLVDAERATEGWRSVRGDAPTEPPAGRGGTPWQILAPEGPNARPDGYAVVTADWSESDDRAEYYVAEGMTREVAEMLVRAAAASTDGDAR